MLVTAPGAIDAYVYTERGVYRRGETVYTAVLLRDEKANAVDGAPVTVVVAADPSGDTERQLESWRIRTAAIPDVELVALNGRHFVMFDQPEEFHALVDKALARAARGS